MTASTGPSGAVSRRTSMVEGSSRPLDLGHHSFGQRQPPIFGLPGRLEGGGVGTVVARDDGSGVGRGETEAARGRSADQATEDRLPVEAGDAQPVDGAVGADERRGSGVSEQPVVLDRDVGCLSTAARSVRCRVESSGQPSFRQALSVDVEQEAQGDAVGEVCGHDDKRRLRAVVEAEQSGRFQDGG